MKATDFNNALEGMAKNAEILAKVLPGRLIEAAKKFSKDDAKKVMEAMNETEFHKKLKDFGVAKQDLQNFIKKF